MSLEYDILEHGVEKGVRKVQPTHPTFKWKNIARAKKQKGKVASLWGVNTIVLSVLLEPY